ncbi:hypothetical protein [Archangium lipolyticum]|uniref:hypothetical protein n=1 Tax=Archangium lipolyticum TaxID=2970465 RepID=UPI00214A5286|nr:hypothetical protein [Archangium lipolyticum]
MTRFSRLMVVSAMMAGLTACGGGAKLGGGKEGAAQAAFQASQPLGRNGKTAQRLLDQALASGATTIAISAKCSQGGEVSLALDLNGAGPVGSLKYSVTYDACSEDGKNEYNGTMATALLFDAQVGGGNASLSFVTVLKGRLTIEGEVSDFIDADVTLSMDISASSMRSGSVKLVTNGSIKTSDGSFTYNNETLTIVAGELPQA